MLAASAEVLCRRSFGRRYSPMLLASFFCCSLFFGVFSRVLPQQSPGLAGLYLLIFFILVLCHIAHAWRRGAIVHSYSSGQSWELWTCLNFNPSLVKILIEPLIFVLGGLLLLSANVLLAIWLMLGGACLFLKELMSNWHFGNRVMDSMDARLEGERLNAVVRQQTTPRGGREHSPTPVTAEPAALPANSSQQAYSRLDPALQRLVAATNQPTHGPTVANRPNDQRVVVLRQGRLPRPNTGGAAGTGGANPQPRRTNPQPQNHSTNPFPTQNRNQ